MPLEFGENICLKVKAAFRSGVNTYLGATLLQQQQQTQSLGVCYVEVVTGEHTHTLSSTSINHRFQVWH